MSEKRELCEMWKLLNNKWALNVFFDLNEQIDVLFSK